jgi:hypothetical protein
VITRLCPIPYKSIINIENGSPTAAHHYGKKKRIQRLARWRASSHLIPFCACCCSMYHLCHHHPNHAFD